MPWISIKTIRRDYDSIEDFIGAPPINEEYEQDEEKESSEKKFSFHNTAIRTEDILDFYEFKKKYIIVKTKWDRKELLVNENFEEFVEKISLIDTLMSISFEEQEELPEEEK